MGHVFFFCCCWGGEYIMIYELKVGVENRWCRDDGCIRSFGGWYFSVLDPLHPGLWAQKELRVQEVLHLQANHQQWALCRTECNLPRQQNPGTLGIFVSNLVSNLRFKIPVFCYNNKERIPASFLQKSLFPKTSGYHIWLPSGILINAKIRWAKIFTENAAKQNHCKCLRALKKPMWDILRYLHIEDIWGIHFS